MRLQPQGCLTIRAALRLRPPVVLLFGPTARTAPLHRTPPVLPAQTLYCALNLGKAVASATGALLTRAFGVTDTMFTHMFALVRALQYN